MPIGAISPATLAVLPRGLTGDDGDDGAPGDQISFNTLGDAVAATIDAAVDHVRTAGYGTVGDGGDDLYYRLGSTPVPAKAWHFQSADGAWWHKVPGGPLNAKTFGAKNDGVTDNSAVLAAIREAFLSGLWNDAYFPYGAAPYNHGTTWDLSGLTNITVRGDAGMDLSHSGAGALCFTGTGDAINLNDCEGVTIRNIGICYTATSGYLINFDCAVSGWNKHRVDACHFYKLGGAAPYTARVCYARRCSDVLWLQNRFSHAANGIIAALNSETAQAGAIHTFIGCDFVYIPAPISNPGLNWAFVGDRFEPSLTGAPAAFSWVGTVHGLTITNCSFSDPTASGTWIDGEDWQGGNVSGCTFSGDIDGSDIVNGIRCNHFLGVAITGNLFSGLTNAIVPTLGSNMIIAGNCFPNTLTAEIANITNLDAASIVGGNNGSTIVWIPRRPSYLKANLPTASSWTAGDVLVVDEVGGSVPAFSDGTNWRRVTDRAVVS